MSNQHIQKQIEEEIRKAYAGILSEEQIKATITWWNKLASRVWEEAEKETTENLLSSVENARSAIKSIHGSIENGYGMNKKALKKDLSYQESCLTNEINYRRNSLKQTT